MSSAHGSPAASHHRSRRRSLVALRPVPARTRSGLAAAGSIVARIERGRTGSVSDEDLLALPALYRTLVSSLAVARETSLRQRDARLSRRPRTTRLVRRLWPARRVGGWLRGFFGGGWSAAVRSLGPDLLIALAVMVAGTVVGWLLVSGNPDWFYALMPAHPGDDRVPGASRAQLYATLFGKSHESGLSIFSAYLFSNNAQVSILCFALGFAFAVPSILLLIQNTALLEPCSGSITGKG
jgi:hypothetical protein